MDPLVIQQKSKRMISNFDLNNLVFYSEDRLSIQDINDDLKREKAFLKQALTCAAQAKRIILAAELPFSPPSGYFCETLKTKKQMDAIENNIKIEKEACKASELARKQRLNRKFGKQIQVEREQQKKVETKSQIKSIENQRKKKTSGATPTFLTENDREFDINVMEEKGGEGERAGVSKRSKNSSSFSNGASSKRRAERDAKYGFGGKKSKRNTSDSTDIDSFNPKRNRKPFPGDKRGNGGGGNGRSFSTKGGNRPGKERRQKSRS